MESKKINDRIIENLDPVDIALLRALQQDARLTTKELAQRVNLSSTPVYERVRRLEREGYIKRYVTVLDAESCTKASSSFAASSCRPSTRKWPRSSAKPSSTFRK